MTARRSLYPFVCFIGCLLATLLLSSPADAGTLPRFASVKSDEANLRTGPGTRYPIRWVYRKTDIPVEIMDEYGNWRKTRDIDGEEGWMHHSLLSGARTVFIYGETRTLHRNPNPDSPAVLKAKPQVLAKLVRCTKRWCYIQIKGRKGWIPKEHIWGVYEDEEF